MRRLMAVAVAVPISVLGAVLWPAAENGLPAAGRSRLNAYLHTAAAGYSVQQVSPAAQPWNLTANSSGPTFADSVYFEATHNLWASSPAWPVAGAFAGVHTEAALRPLPYPPQAVWCVRLAGENTTAPRVVFVALHADLFNADWVVHEAPTGGAEAGAAAVGCELP